MLSHSCMSPTQLTPFLASAAGATAVLLLLVVTIRAVLSLQPGVEKQVSLPDWPGGHADPQPLLAGSHEDEPGLAPMQFQAGAVPEEIARQRVESAAGRMGMTQRVASEVRSNRDRREQVRSIQVPRQPDYLASTVDRWWGINE